MKPKNNRVMCPECFRAKMLFETQKQADNFIKWNGEDIDTHGGELRSYYCPSCGGYHITSKPFKESYLHNTENLIRRYKKDSEIHFVVERDANDISLSIPKDVIKAGKKTLRKYITEYFAEKGIDDNGGVLRTKIYRLLKK